MTTPLSPQESQALLAGPSLAPPVGTTPNFNNPANLNALVIVAMTLCIGSSTAALAMRMWTKIAILRNVGLEDYVAVFGWLLYIPYCAVGGFIERWGGGVHAWNVPLWTLEKNLYYTYIATALYDLTIWVVKSAILIQYYKIFRPVRKMSLMYLGIYGIGVMNTGMYFYLFFSIIFVCNPRRKYWNVLMVGGSCESWNSGDIAGSAFGVGSDILLLALPLHAIWKLQMPRNRKLGVSVFFLVGFLSCAASIVRLIYALKLNSGDETHYIVMIGFATLIK